jgi:TPP-dependent pyruvate/acetoin dehydrogenase alpha subunit
MRNEKDFGDVPPREVLRQLFETMTTVKQTDERFRTLLSSGQISTTYYSPRGQESVSAAVSANLRRDDYCVTTYRGLHDHLAKGVGMRELWAEFLGKAAGTCKGKGGPMHITDPKSGLMVTTGIVGSGLPIANGLGLASKLRGTDQVTVANFGDGASNIGAFHEALNLAAVWDLPVVFVCQNNHYGEHTPYTWTSNAPRVSDRAGAYAMAGVTVDGNDPIATYNAAREAVARARAGEGPTLLEVLTYRFFGHIMSDDMEYMPKPEREAAMAADPVPRFRQWLIDDDHFREGDLAAIERQVEESIDDAVDYALNSPDPAPEELYTDVYSEVVLPA